MASRAAGSACSRRQAATRSGEKGGRIEAIYYCPHSPENNCDCRKPKPGLLQSFADDNKVELKDLF
ncbi:MAG: hypothetical protein ACXWZR_16010, partial [Mycobacterium sp.]